jgi:hypothetical protein
VPIRSDGPDAAKTCAWLSVACFLAFAPALHGSFVWDDVDILLTNAGIASLGWANIRWMFTTLYCTSYQPLGWLAYALIYRVSELDPWAFHMTSLVLHCAVVSLFFLALRRLLEKAGAKAAGWAAAAAALLFAVHPLQASTVAWATEIPDQFSTALFLAAVWSYLGGARRLPLALYAVSLLFRWKGIALPVVLLALDHWPLKRLDRRAWEEKVPYALLAILAVFVNALGKTASSHHAALSSGTARGLLLYPWLVAWPRKLVAVYSLIIPDTLELPAFLAVSLALAVIAGAWVFRRRWPAVWLALFSYGACVGAPLLNIQPGGTLFAFQHYSYLACLPFYALAAEPLRRLWADGRRVPAAALCLALAAGLVPLARRESRVWRDGVTFWTNSLNLDPGVLIGYGNLGAALVNRRRYNEAYLYSAAQLAVISTDTTAAANIAEIKKRAPDLKPDVAAFWAGRAEDSLLVGHADEAARLSAKALSKKPREPEFHRTRARALRALKRDAEAGRHEDAARYWEEHPGRR